MFLVALLLTACGGSGGGGASVSSDASLSNLTASTGVLVSAFNTATLAYTVDVPNATTFVTVTPTAASGYATINVNNAAVASGSASARIALVVGANPINVVVTAQDGTTIQTYTINVTRHDVLWNDATLASLTVSAGTLAPAFGSATTAYTDLVPMASASIDVTATVTSANATMTVNGVAVVFGTSKTVFLPVGQTAIPVVVTAQDGTTTKTYTITVTRPGITLTPASSSITALSSQIMTVTLAASPGTDTVVTLSSDSAAVTVPAGVTVLAGNTQATFSATSVASGAANATITATLGSDAPTATVSVTGQCTVAADCPGTDTICQTRTCISNTCGFSYASSATVCGAASCTSGVATAQSVCDGLGTCVPGVQTSCSNYVCGPNACKTSCTTDFDCSNGYYCASALCMPKLLTGATCTSNSMCASNSCVSSICQ